MLSWVAKKLITYLMARAREGDVEPTLKLDRPDMRFVFPGSNSWSGTFDAAGHRTWMNRLARVGVKTDADEVVAAGLPWNMTVCIRGRSWWDNQAGERIYSNRYVIWAHLKWGRMQEYEVYEDTEKAAALDEYLEQHEPTLAAA